MHASQLVCFDSGVYCSIAGHSQIWHCRPEAIHGMVWFLRWPHKVATAATLARECDHLAAYIREQQVPVDHHDISLAKKLCIVIFVYACLVLVKIHIYFK